MTQPLHTLHTLQSRWKDQLATALVLETPEARLALIQVERDYTFLWRRTRHRVLWPKSAIGQR